MTICRSCGHASPGNGAFCEGCGRSFNARLCPAKHVSSPNAEYCATCGTDDLSTATPGIRISLPSGFIRFVIVLVLAKLLFSLLPQIFGLSLDTADSLLRFVFGISFDQVLCWLLGHFVAWFVVWVVLRTLFGEKSKVLKAYTDLSLWAIRCAVRALGWAVKAVWTALSGYQSVTKGGGR